MPKSIFAGGEMDSVQIVSGTPTTDTTASRFDSTYARCAITVSGSAVLRGYFLDESSAYTSVTTGQSLWFHIEAAHQIDSGNVTNVIELIDSSNQPWVSIRQVAQYNFAVAWNSGTGGSPAWTEITATRFNHNGSTRNIFDLKVTLGSPHSVEMYLNNNLVGVGTFTQASLTSLSRFNLRPAESNRSMSYSQIYVTEGIATVGAKVNSRSASAAGTTNTFTSGAYTDVNENVHNDTTNMSSNTAGQVYTHAYQDTTVPGGYGIRSVFTWARGKNGGLAPNNFQHACRNGGTDYFSPNVAGIGIGYMPLGAQWANDPATSAPWTQTGFNNAEFGGKSIT